jgi:hypothetical protein
MFIYIYLDEIGRLGSALHGVVRCPIQIAAYNGYLNMSEATESALADIGSQTARFTVYTHS